LSKVTGRLGDDDEERVQRSGSVLSVPNKNGTSFVVVFVLLWIVAFLTFIFLLPFNYHSYDSKFLDPSLTNGARESGYVPSIAFVRMQGALWWFILSARVAIVEPSLSSFLHESFIYKPSSCSTL
jgi:hypothetical protein